MHLLNSIPHPSIPIFQGLIPVCFSEKMALLKFLQLVRHRKTKDGFRSSFVSSRNLSFLLAYFFVLPLMIVFFFLVQGTADAIRKCLWVLEQYQVLEFLILPGHHLYKMNYQKLIKAHRDNDADITVAVHNSSRNQDPGFGSFRIDSKNRVVEFVDQPQNNHVKKPLTFIV